MLYSTYDTHTNAIADCAALQPHPHVTWQGLLISINTFAEQKVGQGA
jgi:hypothetical protein